MKNISTSATLAIPLKEREKRLGLGLIYITPGARENVSLDLMTRCLKRHASCDWGELCQDDMELNDSALENGHIRILSSYKLIDHQMDMGPKKLWIITEADRSVTTILLPEEY